MPAGSVSARLTVMTGPAMLLPTWRAGSAPAVWSGPYGWDPQVRRCRIHQKQHAARARARAAKMAVSSHWNGQ